ncbi:MAG: VanW family protein [Blautia sp.]|nr:VanW family protein [Blautia sp.]MCM1200356.1 VanW family protein [Bacteroides fragilis]
MLKKKGRLTVITALAAGLLSMSMTVHAEEEIIEAGIYADRIALSGMTVSEAKNEVQGYVDSFGDVQITLHAMDDQAIVTTASEIGLKWANPEIIDEAAGLGKDGNIVQCYKALKDLEHSNKVYEVEFDFDKDKIRTLIEEQGTQYNKEAVDAVLTKTNGVFQVEAGQAGMIIDVGASTEEVYHYLVNDWQGEAGYIDLAVAVQEPRGSAEELAQVTDVLGTYTTSFSTSNGSRSANVANGCRLIDGHMLYPGDEFSAYEAVSPFSEANGYYMAASYLNGQVVDSLGGGICQVSTTLYNAVLRAELEVTERYNHSMIVTYVDPSADAAIAESSGKDFKFVNNTNHPIYIEGITTPDKHITFTIYGVETRDSNREVVYESVVLERIEPEEEVIYANESLPLGYCSVQSAHVGYRAQLWKVVKVDGVEISREQVNSSSYNKSPRNATVGTATADPEAYNAIMAAIATNSIDQVKAVAGAYQAQAAAAAAQQPPAPAELQPVPAEPQPAEPQPVPEEPETESEGSAE